MHKRPKTRIERSSGSKGHGGASGSEFRHFLTLAHRDGEPRVLAATEMVGGGPMRTLVTRQSDSRGRAGCGQPSTLIADCGMEGNRAASKFLTVRNLTSPCTDVRLQCGATWIKVNQESRRI